MAYRRCSSSDRDIYSLPVNLENKLKSMYDNEKRVSMRDFI